MDRQKPDFSEKKRECDFLIRALSDHIAARQTAAPGELDWAFLVKLARMQQVFTLLYAQCKAFLPPEEKRALENDHNTALFLYGNRVSDAAEIGAAFEAASVPFFFVKGLPVAQYYPVPALRTMGDGDLVVRPEDAEKAVAIMRSLGFSGEKGHEGHALVCERKGRRYEVHTLLADGAEYRSPAPAAFFNDFAPFIRGNTLDPSFHFLFLLSHLRKHFLRSGVGLRQFLDLAVMITRCPALDWQWIGEKLEEISLAPFASACFALLDALFGVRAPLPFDAMSPADAALMTERILKGGAFGFADPENAAFRAKRELTGRGPRWIRRLRLFWKSAFLPYEQMKAYPGCGFLDGRPVLLPAAWLYRFWIILWRKDKASTRETVQNVLIPEEEVARREQYLRAMRLFDER